MKRLLATATLAGLVWLLNELQRAEQTYIANQGDELL